MEASSNPTLGDPNLEAIEGKESNETDLLMTVQLVKEDDFQGHQGFDLYDPEQVEWESLSISKLATYQELTELIACKIKQTVEQFRIWPIVERLNNTMRPKALDWETCLGKSVHDVAENCNPWTCYLELLPPDSGLSALPPFQQNRMVLLFFKYYDAATNKILYAGRHYALIDRPLADLVPILLQRAGLPPRTQLEFYEELESGLIETIERVDQPLKAISEDLMDGDIICYQKYDPEVMKSQLSPVKKYFNDLQSRNEVKFYNKMTELSSSKSVVDVNSTSHSPKLPTSPQFQEDSDNSKSTELTTAVSQPKKRAFETESLDDFPRQNNEKRKTPNSNEHRQIPNDIVSNLHEFGVVHIFEEICSYLDYSDIKSATQVCRNWRHLLTSNTQIWKSLWHRNIALLPQWNLLYKRAICQRSDSSLSEWSPQEACRAVGDVYQKMLRNLHKGKCAEKVDNESNLYLFDVGSTKIVRAGRTGGEIHVQNRWRLHESPTSFNVTDQHSTITHLEISEPYLFVVAINSDQQNFVIVWDLEKEKKICEFSLEKRMDAMFVDCVNIKCSNNVLITCCCYWNVNDECNVTLLTARQMPCSSHPEVNFPVIDELTISDFECQNNSIYVEDQRIVLFDFFNGTNFRAKLFIISMKPFRVIRMWKLEEAGGFRMRSINSGLIHDVKEANYWNGWLLQSQGDAQDATVKDYTFARIRFTNIDTGEVILYQINHLVFYVVNNHLFTLTYPGDGVWKFDVFTLPNSNCPKEVKFLHSIIQCKKNSPKRGRIPHTYSLKIHFDGIQFWFCVYKTYFYYNYPPFFAVKDFAC